jgi:hypothetical protein
MNTLTQLMTVLYQTPPERDWLTTPLLLITLVMLLAIVGSALISETKTLASVIATVVANILVNLRILVGVLLAILLVFAVTYYGQIQTVIHHPPWPIPTWPNKPSTTR